MLYAAPTLRASAAALEMLQSRPPFVRDCGFWAFNGEFEDPHASGRSPGDDLGRGRRCRPRPGAGPDFVARRLRSPACTERLRSAEVPPGADAATHPPRCLRSEETR